MPRNFDRRVEVMFPVEAEDLRRRIVDEIIPAYLNDNRRARLLLPEGDYVRTDSRDGEPPHRSQLELLEPVTPRPAATPPVEAAPMPPSFDVTLETNGAPDREKKKRKDKKDKKRSAAER
jgi:polyphosphate kinase